MCDSLCGSIWYVCSCCVLFVCFPLFMLYDVLGATRVCVFVCDVLCGVV